MTERTPQGEDAVVVLCMNEYQAVNLRWLLAIALHGIPSLKACLNTGDWNGELLWEIEQQIIDAGLKQAPNVSLGELPKMSGWHGGMTTAELDKLLADKKTST
jgi:hypothetical protein